MKHSLLFLFFIPMAVGFHLLDLENNFKKMYWQCVESTGVTDEEVSTLEGGRIPNTQKLKEFLLCINIQNNIQDENGKFNTDVLRKKMKNPLITSQSVEAIILKCTSEQETPEESAYHFLKCARDIIMTSSNPE